MFFEEWSKNPMVVFCSIGAILGVESGKQDSSRSRISGVELCLKQAIFMIVFHENGGLAVACAVH